MLFFQFFQTRLYRELESAVKYVLNTTCSKSNIQLLSDGSPHGMKIMADVLSDGLAQIIKDGDYLKVPVSLRDIFAKAHRAYVKCKSEYGAIADAVIQNVINDYIDMF